MANTDVHIEPVTTASIPVYHKMTELTDKYVYEQPGSGGGFEYPAAGQAYPIPETGDN